MKRFLAPFLIVGLVALVFARPFVNSLQPSAGLAMVQAVKAHNATSNSIVTISPTSGNLLHTTLVTYNGFTNSEFVSDNVNGTTNWTKVATQIGINGCIVSVWYQKNIPAGITNVTGGAGGFSSIVIIHEISGASTTAPFTTGESAKLTEDLGLTTFNPGTITNATANSVIIGSYAREDVASTNATMTLNQSGTIGTYALKDNANSQETNGVTYVVVSSVPYQIVSSSTSQSHTWGVRSGAGNAGIIAAFH